MSAEQLTHEQAGEMLSAILSGKAHKVDACRHYRHAHPPKHGSLWDVLDLSYRSTCDVVTIDFHTIAVRMPRARERRYYAGKCSCGEVFYWEARDGR